MKKNFILITAIISFSISSYAQVGIGGVPDSSSILDLTNLNSKYLILPTATSDPTSNTQFTNAPGALIYFNDKMYYNTSSGLKILTPWEWNLSTPAISSPLGTPVGIGVVPTTLNYQLIVDLRCKGANINLYLNKTFLKVRSTDYLYSNWFK